jgi:L-fucose mutarotase/ribose pyranase (RbsD/FucU family)
MVTAFAASTLAAGNTSAASPAASDWLAVLRQRLLLYGHRNWIVIADSAYPAQSRPGIETLVSDASHLDVLRATLAELSHSKHVRAITYQDAELAFLSEQDAPGVNDVRTELRALMQTSTLTQPHEEIIHRLDQTAQTFRVLIIKTTLTVPYTSVFFELRAAYWSDEAERRLRDAMAKRR